MLEICPALINNLQDQISILKDELEELMILIIDERENSDMLRTWLYEPYGTTDKVIDHLGFHKPINLLQHPKMTKTVEQIWFGIYDLTTFFRQDEDYLLPYFPPKYSDLNGINGIDAFSMILPNHLFGVFKYPFQSVKKMYYRFQDKSNTLEKKNMIRAPRWGFAFYRNSIYFKYFLFWLFDLLSLIFFIVFYILNTLYMKN
jgi:hypothetical protein